MKPIEVWTNMKKRRVNENTTASSIEEGTDGESDIDSASIYSMDIFSPFEIDEEEIDVTSQ